MRAVLRPKVEVPARRAEHTVVLHAAGMRLVVSAAEVEVLRRVDYRAVVPEDAARSEEVAADVDRGVCFVGDGAVVPWAVRGAVESAAGIHRDGPEDSIPIGIREDRSAALADGDREIESLGGVILRPV